VDDFSWRVSAAIEALIRKSLSCYLLSDVQVKLAA
jgi:hypothetical protein